MFKRMLLFAAVAAAALLGASCTSSTTESIYPMTVGSVWHMSMYTLSGTALASLDTVSTGTQTITALAKANLTNGNEVTKLQSDLSTRFKLLDTTLTSTTYSYVAEVGDTIFDYADLNDIIGRPVMRSSPAVGQTWTEDSSTTATVVGQEDVTVTAGTYKGAWKVKFTTSANGRSMDTYEWFAPGTGLVKASSDFTANGVQTVSNSELTSATIK